MADKEKKAAESSKVDKTASDENKAAAKVAKAAKGSGKKSDKPNVFSRMGTGIKRFFKDFKGESKKIVWPDAKTVLKSTGVVLLVVAIVSIIIWGIDTGLTAGISGLKHVASGSEETTVSETVAGETTTAADKKDDNSETTADAATTTADASATTTQAEVTTAESK